jgi:hypothetical protein
MKGASLGLEFISPLAPSRLFPISCCRLFHLISPGAEHGAATSQTRHLQAAATDHPPLRP